MTNDIHVYTTSNQWTMTCSTHQYDDVQTGKIDIHAVIDAIKAIPEFRLVLYIAQIQEGAVNIDESSFTRINAENKQLYKFHDQDVDKLEPLLRAGQVDYIYARGLWNGQFLSGIGVQVKENLILADIEEKDEAPSVIKIAMAMKLVPKPDLNG